MLVLWLTLEVKKKDKVFTWTDYWRQLSVKRDSSVRLLFLSKLRNIENYAIGIELNNPKKTGIKEDCIFNQIDYFHSILNKVLEIMHDFFEGTNKYVICQVLLYFIEKDIITLDKINECLSKLDYSEEEVKYLPKPFDMNKLKENNLKMSARSLGNSYTYFLFAWEIKLIMVTELGN